MHAPGQRPDQRLLCLSFGVLFFCIIACSMKNKEINISS